MKALIIYLSIHHQNTKKIAEIMAKELKAKLVTIAEAEKEDFKKYDLIGFGSGIYMWKHHRRLLDFVDSLRLTGLRAEVDSLSSLRSLDKNSLSLQSHANKVNQQSSSSRDALNPKTEEFLLAPREPSKNTKTLSNLLSLSAKEQFPRESLTYKQSFIFSTRGAPILRNYHAALKNKLLAKGFKIVGEFSCLGWDSFGPLKLIGGINKDRPNQKDLEKAQEFARSLKIR